MVARVAVDAMGGDLGPQAAVEGAVLAARELALPVVLVGDERTIREHLEKIPGPRAPVDVCHAAGVVEMTDEPARALRAKRDASMAVALELVKRGEATSMVSPGNTGAVMAFALHILRRLPQVERPALTSVVPTIRGEAVMLDMGANVDCKPSYLAQFALMGEAFARMVQGKTRPKVALLSNGTEPGKGNAATRAAAKLIGAIDELDFAGCIEGRDVFAGNADVIVHDGFVGNILLKTLEGAVDAIRTMLKQEIERSAVSKVAAVALKPAFERFKKRFDWTEYGGAPLIGVRGVVVVCHGASPPRAFTNAIRLASRFASTGLNDALVTQLRKNAHLLDEGKRGLAQERRAQSTRGPS